MSAGAGGERGGDGGAGACGPDYVLPEGYTWVYSGKVRDLWRTPDEDLLFVATDRISAFDWILPTLIPDKGRILTAASLWWAAQVRDLVPDHVVSEVVPEVVAGRAVVCRALQMVPVECVARGYLSGSGLVEYRRTGAVCGVGLPDGLTEGSQLPAPIFTPATKAALGEHDENIDFDTVVATVGLDTAESLRRLTLDIYARARSLAAARGIILADTKFEFGWDGEQLILADEVLTPDSSRYWPADQWRPGVPQPSFDKQIVRDWLLSPSSGWDRDSGAPPPPLPDEVVERTRARYIEVYERLTGEKFE